MLKLTAIVSLMLIGSSMWAASLSCDSCGSECAAACGTRHFRSCCFNYLRRKRGPDALKYWPQNPHEVKPDNQQGSRTPVYIIDSAPEPWTSNLVSSDFRAYPVDDAIDNRLQLVYDA